MTAALETTWLGMTLRSPLVASPSPLTGRLDSIIELAEAGAGAIVLPSLFEEQIEGDVGGVTAVAPEADLTAYNLGLESYLALIRAAKQRVEVPVIASLNGTEIGDWLRYTRLVEDAGADAIEVNLYRVAADPTVSSAALEADQHEVVAVLADDVTIPLTIKISPYYSSLAWFVEGLERAGAEGVTMFNRFYQPHLDPETLTVSPTIALSTPEESVLVTRWVAILAPRLQMSIAASTGIHSGVDAARVLLAGADVAMTTSALLRNGPGHLIAMEADLRRYLDRHGADSVAEIRGRAHQAETPDPEAYERANYIGVLATSWQRFVPDGSPAGDDQK